MGIEGTAHTLGIGIITERGEILADERSVYKPALGKGILPHEARLHHEKEAKFVLRNALKKSRLSLEDIDIFAYSCGPGLPPPLIFTANFAIWLSKKYKKPLIKVHHGVGHIEIARLLTKAKDPVILFLSGGHNMILACAEGFYRVFGETEDITLGNCLDVVAREMGFQMPGGPEIEKLAKKGKYVELPYVVKGMDVSFSGIMTAAIKLLKKGIPKEDVAYSLQETCFAMLTEVTERALAHTGKDEVLLVGGVAANKRLQAMIKRMCEERGAKFYVVPKKYAQDNGVQIAWVGVLAYKSGWKDLNTKKDKINSLVALLFGPKYHFSLLVGDETIWGWDNTVTGGNTIREYFFRTKPGLFSKGAPIAEHTILQSSYTSPSSAILRIKCEDIGKRVWGKDPTSTTLVSIKIKIVEKSEDFSKEGKELLNNILDAIIDQLTELKGTI